MTRNDRAALKLAIEVAGAEFCASCCQSHSLGLMPWQIAPVDYLPSDLNSNRQRGAAAAAAMLAAEEALRRFEFHPDPLAAIAEAERAAP